MVTGGKMPGISGGFWIFNDFREMSLCGPYRACFSFCFSQNYSNIREIYKYKIYFIQGKTHPQLAKHVYSNNAIHRITDK